MIKRCKRQWDDDVANEVENAANLGSMKGVYDATRNLCNDRPRNITTVKDKEGKLGADHLTFEGGGGWMISGQQAFFFLATWWAGYFFSF